MQSCDGAEQHGDLEVVLTERGNRRAGQQVLELSVFHMMT